jgi:anti-sigma regulatory factor (Ser/Thr protein kinase)
LLVVAIDVAGHGAEAADQALFVRGWLSGWVRAFPSVPRLESCVSALTDVLSLVNINASWFVALISALGTHEVEYIALAHGMPEPLLMLDDRDATLVSVAKHGQPPIRHAPLSAPWKLIIASDGLLERLGAGDARRGKQSLLRWQSSGTRAQPAADQLGASGAGADDETLMILEWDGWDIDLELEASRDADVDRAGTVIDRWLMRRVDADQACVIANGLVEAVDNARAHAYANGPGLLRVRARDEGSHIRLRVEDRGTWRGAEMQEGLGLRYMRAKADRVDLWRTSLQGATISLVYTMTAAGAQHDQSIRNRVRR